MFFFVSCDLEICKMILKNNREPLLYCFELCASFESNRQSETQVTVRKRSIRVKIGDFFVPCDLEIWQITLKNNRAPLLYCFRLCASFHSHQWILTGVTVRKPPIWVKIDFFLVSCDLKFARWSWKTIGNLFYNASSFVHHLKAIGKLKLKSQSGNAQSGSKSAIFLSRVTLKFDR